MTDSEFLTPRDLARLSGFSDSFIRAEIKAGNVAATQFGRSDDPKRLRWKIHRNDANRYVRTMARRHPPTVLRSALISCVYFIETDAYIKIGWTGNLFQRLYDLACAIPTHLTGLGIIALPPEQCERKEAEIHRMFAFHRHRGEWFQDHPEIRGFIETKCQSWPERTH